MAKTSLKPTASTCPAFSKAGFFAALSGYITCFDPQPTYMVAMPDDPLSPAEWLAQADGFANDLPDEQDRLLRTMSEVKQLVAKGQYDESRRIVQQGSQAADAQIRALRQG